MTLIHFDTLWLYLEVRDFFIDYMYKSIHKKFQYHYSLVKKNISQKQYKLAQIIKVINLKSYFHSQSGSIINHKPKFLANV